MKPAVHAGYPSRLKGIKLGPDLPETTGKASLDALRGNVQLDLKERACPLCGASDDSFVVAPQNFDSTKLDKFAFSSRKLPEYMHFRLVKCPQCSLTYANPAPSRESLESQYAQAAYDSSDVARQAAKTYAGLVLSIIPRLKEKTAALDIGAGDGAFLQELIRLGFSPVVGCEPSAAPIEDAPENIRPLIRQTAFSQDSFGEMKFSLITCFQTIEHLYDPLSVGRSIHELLDDGGAILIVCHNSESLSARLLGKGSPIFDIEHLQLFNRKSLKKYLWACGFKEVEVKRVWNRYPLRYWVRLLPLPRPLKSRALKLLKRTRLGELMITLPAGNMAAAGYKKA